MKTKTAFRNCILILVISTCLASTGCMRYYRLLEFKKQLKEIDTYFTYVDYNGLYCDIHEAVLTIDDIKWLGLFPTENSQIKDKTVWLLNFVNQHPEYDSSSSGYHLVVKLTFQNGLLSRVELPHSFMRLVPTDLLKFYLSSFGNANINLAKQNLAIDFDKVPGGAPMLFYPRYEDFIETLGQPLEIKEMENNKFQCKFSYKLDSNETNLPVVANVSFKKHLNTFQHANFYFGPYRFSFNDRVLGLKY